MPAEGLDIPDAEYVINYSFPRPKRIMSTEWEDRQSRQGRWAHSFTRTDKMLAGCLVHAATLRRARS